MKIIKKKKKKKKKKKNGKKNELLLNGRERKIERCEDKNYLFLGDFAAILINLLFTHSIIFQNADGETNRSKIEGKHSWKILTRETRRNLRRISILIKMKTFLVVNVHKKLSTDTSSCYHR